MQYSKFFTFHSIVIALSILLLCSATNVLAQNESSVRPWRSNDSILVPFNFSQGGQGEYKFHAAYPIIRNIPPLHSSMPSDVLMGYITIDSILRQPWGPNFRNSSTRCITNPLREYIRNMPVNDSLFQLYKYYYTLVDFNPIIFKQYKEKLGENVSYIRSRYPLSLHNILDIIPETFHRAFPNEKDYDRYYALLLSSHILRVRITGIDSMPPLRNFSDVTYGVNAEVLDTIKGKYFAPCHIGMNNTLSDEIKNTQNCISLWHTNFSLTCSDGATLGSFLPCTLPLYRWPCFTMPSAFYKGPSSGYKFTVGQEAIVFTKVGTLLTKNDQADFFEAGLQNHVSAGALYIDENNMVHDPNKIWSEQTVLPYEQWRAIVQQHINNILTKNYAN